MAKFVIDAREYSTSTGRYISVLIEYLEQIDQSNDYIILLKPDDLQKCDLTNPRFVKFITPYKEFSLGEQLGFAWQLYKLKPDLVHFGMTQQPILYHKRSVTTIHDLTTVRFNNPDKNPVVFFVKQQLYKFVVWYAAHKSKAVITDSQYVKKDVVDYTGIKPDKVTVAYLAADKIKESSVPIKGLRDKKFIMYVGRPMPHKNLWRLIEAYDLLKPMYPDLYLVLAGKLDNNYIAIKQRVKKAAISGVIFADFVSEGQLKWLYENTRVYVFPSLSEGFGLPGLEAMAHGAPVVSSNATCLPEVYGDAARYFDPLDKFAISQAIADVLSDTGLRKSLIANGYKCVAKYSWQHMAEQTLEVYKQAL